VTRSTSPRPPSLLGGHTRSSSRGWATLAAVRREGTASRAKLAQTLGKAIVPPRMSIVRNDRLAERPSTLRERLSECRQTNDRLAAPPEALRDDRLLLRETRCAVPPSLHAECFRRLQSKGLDRLIERADPRGRRCSPECDSAGPSSESPCSCASSRQDNPLLLFSSAPGSTHSRFPESFTRRQGGKEGVLPRAQRNDRAALGRRIVVRVAIGNAGVEALPR